MILVIIILIIVIGIIILVIIIITVVRITLIIRLCDVGGSSEFGALGSEDLGFRV